MIELVIIFLMRRDWFDTRPAVVMWCYYLLQCQALLGLFILTYLDEKLVIRFVVISKRCNVLLVLPQHQAFIGANNNIILYYYVTHNYIILEVAVRRSAPPSPSFPPRQVFASSASRASRSRPTSKKITDVAANRRRGDAAAAAAELRPHFEFSQARDPGIDFHQHQKDSRHIWRHLRKDIVFSCNLRCRLIFMCGMSLVI